MDKYVYFTNADNLQKPHLIFIGRWTPLHHGHIHIIEQKVKEKNLPVLILVRNTSFDEFNAEERAEMIKKWMVHNNIKGTVMIIPDIEGVYYGRGVGYNVEEIKVEAEIEYPEVLLVLSGPEQVRTETCSPTDHLPELDLRVDRFEEDQIRYLVYVDTRIEHIHRDGNVRHCVLFREIVDQGLSIRGIMVDDLGKITFIMRIMVVELLLVEFRVIVVPGENDGLGQLVVA